LNLAGQNFLTLKNTKITILGKSRKKWLVRSVLAESQHIQYIFLSIIPLVWAHELSW
jgi:hypothetical protein